MKNIKLEFYRVNTIDNDNHDDKVRFDLTPLLNRVLHIGVTDRTFPYFNERARLNNCAFQDGFWRIQFLRIRDNNLPPAYTDDEGNFDFIELEDGQYIAEPVNAIYNSVDNVFLLQRYLYGLPPSGIELYLTEAWNTRGNRLISLDPILVGRRINEITPRTFYKKADFSIEVPERIENEDTGNRSLNGLLDDYKRMGASRVHAIISAKKTRDGCLDSITMSELIHGLYQSENIKKLKIGYSNEGQRVEHVDLLEDKLSDIIKMDVSKENPLRHERLIPEMINCYNRNAHRLR